MGPLAGVRAGNAWADGVAVHRLLEHAAALSYLDGFRVMAALLFAAAPFVWIMKKPHFKSE